MTRSQLLAMPGVSALVVAGLSFAALVADPSNAMAIQAAAKKRKDDIFCRYCKVVLAIRELEKLLPPPSLSGLGAAAVGANALVPYGSADWGSACAWKLANGRSQLPGAFYLGTSGSTGAFD